jgi:hypothetical protein
MRATIAARVEFDLRRLPYVWSSLTKEQQQISLDSSPLAAPLVSSLTWARHWTKTWDEHDLQISFKALPDWPYFDYLHESLLAEPVLFVPKSRTMMVTWWAVIECLHSIMTHQPASCIFWCPDEDRAVKCIKYAKVLYAQQDAKLKELYPLDKPLEQQPVYSFNFGNGGSLMALPGKNPDKIRSEHPTIVMMDEAAFNEHGAEAYANALSTRPTKLLAVSSAEAGWFFEMLEPAWGHPEPMDPLKGLEAYRIPVGKPGAGIKVVRLHYLADPTWTPERIESEKVKYPDITLWDKEMEIDPNARSGQLLFPTFDSNMHVLSVDKQPCAMTEINRDGYTVWLVCDPHPRAPHAFLWLAADRNNELHVIWSWWPDKRKIVSECVEYLQDFDKYAPGLKPYRQLMDVAGKSFNADEEHNYFDAFEQYRIYFQPAKRNREEVGDEAIREVLVPRPYGDGLLRPKLQIWDKCGDNAKLVWQIKNARYKELSGSAIDRDPPEKAAQKERHLVDTLCYALLDNPHFVPPRRRGGGGGFEPIYPASQGGTGY